ncbi:prolyl-tRNA synthetase associated domain-containing protein [uncultured Aquitalea sp.]|uniref:prolyl-tRNA synthetase associated domain-containing protein n=1 Tax=uncultured Aquitalea sp. TaxID=540272 RepID=UPI0025DE041E|nr:prolyl-tRNA synthetase associated domain-containing protein [uncultured Aquitalea sp.]
MEKQLLAFLAKHGIAHLRFDHPPVYTCEEASRIIPGLPGAETKNLFLKAGNSGRYLLAAVPAEARVDLKALAATVGCKNLGFASAERLRETLGLEAGSVTLLAAFCDVDAKVDVLIDAELVEADAVLCHPLVNTATLALPTAELLRFLALTRHPPRILPVPRKLDAPAD